MRRWAFQRLQRSHSVSIRGRVYRSFCETRLRVTGTQQSGCGNAQQHLGPKLEEEEGRKEGRRLIEGQDRDVNAKSRIEYLMETCEVTVGFERLLPISSRVRGAERGRRQVGRGWVRWSIPCTIIYGPLLGREVR